MFSYRIDCSVVGGEELVAFGGVKPSPFVKARFLGSNSTDSSGKSGNSSNGDSNCSTSGNGNSASGSGSSGGSSGGGSSGGGVVGWGSDAVEGGPILHDPDPFFEMFPDSFVSVIWEEKFKPFNSEDLPILAVEIWNYSPSKEHSFMGKLEINLSEEVSIEREGDVWDKIIALRPRIGKQDKVSGTLRIRIRFQSEFGIKKRSIMLDVKRLVDQLNAAKSVENMPRTVDAVKELIAKTFGESNKDVVEILVAAESLSQLFQGITKFSTFPKWFINRGIACSLGAAIFAHLLQNEVAHFKLLNMGLGKYIIFSLEYCTAQLHDSVSPLTCAAIYSPVVNIISNFPHTCEEEKLELLQNMNQMLEFAIHENINKPGIAIPAAYVALRSLLSYGKEKCAFLLKLLPGVVKVGQYDYGEQLAPQLALILSSIKSS